MHKKMAEKNLVEEAVIQLKNLEEAINENAKEILESTMKQEISELVKESLNEANEDEMDFEDSEEESYEEMGSEDESEEESDEEESEEEDFEDEESDDEDSEEEFEFDEESPEVMDFTAMDNSPETHDLLMTVFKKMKPEDEVEITKDGDYVNLKDGEDEYLLSVNESEEEEDDDDEDFESELEETIYEIAMDGENDYDEEELEDDGETNETIYELHMDDTEMSDEDGEEEFEYQEEMEEDYQAEEYMNESKGGSMSHTHKGIKAGMKPVIGKGAKIGGKASKEGWHKHTPSTKGFKEDMKAANPTKGTGKPKFEYKESTKKMAKGEFKEAARTLGNGSDFRKGGLPKRRAHSSANINMKENYELMEEVQMLRAKNEEYRKALNLFRDKLNEVAVFNSNLAYTTRLFTEHSTSKQEKINILRRFDSAETLKESKNLYKSIKDELSSSNKGNINESFERVIDHEPVTGSAQSLIESKTYENPQFMRMKDLMTKIIK
jgi:hypothetical protein